MKKINFSSVLLTVFTLLLLIATSTSTFAWDSATERLNAGQEKAIYRLYNIKSGEHLFTADENEYNSLSSMGDWNAEGIAWYAPGNIGDNVYRLYNKGTGYHLYTMDQNEVRTLVYPTTSPWQADNIIGGFINPVYYSGGSRAIYRLYSPTLAAHLLTADENEYNILGQNGWNREGIALYALR